MSAGVLRPKAFLTSLILAASVALLVLLVLWSPQGARSQTTFTVTKTDDTADGVCDADCALREAVIAANALPGADTIEVPAGMYGLTIAGDDDTAAAGDLDITDNLTLAGGGSGLDDHRRERRRRSHSSYRQLRHAYNREHFGRYGPRGFDLRHLR